MTLRMLEKSKSHRNKTNSYICQEEITEHNVINQCKVRDYCHYTGK